MAAYNVSLSKLLVLSLTEEQLRAVLEIIGAQISSTNEHGTPLALAEYEMETALIECEKKLSNAV